MRDFFNLMIAIYERSLVIIVALKQKLAFMPKFSSVFEPKSYLYIVMQYTFI